MSPKLRKQRFMFHKLQFRVLQGSADCREYKRHYLGEAFSDKFIQDNVCQIL